MLLEYFFIENSRFSAQGIQSWEALQTYTIPIIYIMVGLERRKEKIFTLIFLTLINPILHRFKEFSLKLFKGTKISVLSMLNWKIQQNTNLFLNNLQLVFKKLYYK